MKRQYQQINVTFKVILLLCICSTVLGEIPQRRTSLEGDIDCSVIVEDTTLVTMVVYIGYEWYSCLDTLVIENINLRIKRGSCKKSPGGCGVHGRRRDGWVPLTDTDILFYNCGTFWWEKVVDSSDAVYSAIIDSVSLRKLNGILDSFEMSPASCMPEFRRNELKLFEELRNRK